MAVSDQAKRVLDLMVKEAKDGVWEGTTTKLLARLEIPAPYYSRIMNTLQECGAIKQVRRGGGSSPSKWQIVDPDVDINEAKIAKRQVSRRAMEERLDNIEERIGDIDVKRALVQLSGDVEYLKRKIET